MYTYSSCALNDEFTYSGSAPDDESTVLTAAVHRMKSVHFMTSVLASSVH